MYYKCPECSRTRESKTRYPTNIQLCMDCSNIRLQTINSLEKYKDKIVFTDHQKSAINYVLKELAEYYDWNKQELDMHKKTFNL